MIGRPSHETDEDICGQTYDHDAEYPDPRYPTYWTCKKCGAEGDDGANEQEAPL